MIREFCNRRALSLLRIYWRLFRPSTYGVKVVVLHKAGARNRVLLIRNTYGDRAKWHLPGGGYSPRRETPEIAARREVREETGISIEILCHLDNFYSNAEWKRDHIAVFVGISDSDNLKLGSEIDSAGWFDFDQVDTLKHLSSVTQRALLLAKAYPRRTIVS